MFMTIFFNCLYILSDKIGLSDMDKNNIFGFLFCLVKSILYLLKSFTKLYSFILLIQNYF